MAGLAGKSASGAVIGGTITEIISAPVAYAGDYTKPDDSNGLLQSNPLAPADGSADTDLENTPYSDNNPLMTGRDSILQNQSLPDSQSSAPPAVSPAPKAVRKVLPSYTAGPYLDGYFIFPTSGYDRGKLHYYNAVDISHGDSCLSENIPVYAAASGLISAIYPTMSTSRYANGGYGNNILMLHPNGILTRYAHLKAILVSAGQYVGQGDIIGYMGGYPGDPGSGNSTGCHLHFEVRGAKNPFAR